MAAAPRGWPARSWDNGRGHHRLGDVLAGQLPAEIRVAELRRGVELRGDAAGHDVAHPDAVVADVLHHRLTETVQAEFRGVVGGPARKRVDARQARDVEDVPAAALPHLRDRLAAAIEGAG